MKPRLRHAVTALKVAGAVVLLAGIGCVSLSPAAANADPPLNRAALRAAIALRLGEPATGVVARVVGGGQLWHDTFGDTHTGRPIPTEARFRIGSISKTFEAVVVLQLVTEHRIDLDQTVQHYLRGLLPATYQPITVRELLTMTSGLPDIDAGAPALTPDQIIDGRLQYRSFDQISRQTLRPTGRPSPAPLFAPGTKQAYNSLGYRIAGAIIEHVTGHPYADEVTARILRPLSLVHTFVPHGDPHLPAPYLHGYLTNSRGDLIDVSEQGGDPSSMVSTAPDLDRFITALFHRRLLLPAQLNAMFALPPVPYLDNSECTTGPHPGRACMGAGLTSTTLPDGTVLWGKTGHDLGYASGVFATRDLTRLGVYAVSTTTLSGNAPAVAYRLAAAAFTT
jgi:D-alanyl-D-alanine carboxypeptidase